MKSKDKSRNNSQGTIDTTVYQVYHNNNRFKNELSLKAYLHDTICRIQFLLWRMETSADVMFLLVR